MIRARAITLIESVISTVIIATAMVAALGVVSESARGRRVLEETRTGVATAQQVMGEILQRAYEDPTAGSITLGADAGESNSSQYDDVDDFHGLARSCGDGMAISVAVAWADPSAPSQAGATNSGLKRVVVTISKNARLVTRLESLRSAGPPEVRACCLADAACQQMTRAQCAAAGGVWGTVGSSCWSSSCPGMTSELRVHWEFSELLGNNVADTMGNANGNAQNGPTRTTAGAIGGAMSFDGVNDSVEGGNGSGMVDLDGSITVAGWVRKASNSGYDCVVSKGARGSDCNFWLGTLNDKPAFAWMGKNPQEFVASAVSLPIGQWRHIAGTYNASTGEAAIYVSGVLVGSWTTSDGLVPNTQDVLGAATGKTTDYFHGMIDDVRIYARALSQAEIAWLVSQSTGGASVQGVQIDLSAENALGITVGGGGSP